MYMVAVINRVWRCTGSHKSSTLKYTWKLLLCGIADLPGGLNEAYLEMHLEAKIEGIQRCPWRQ
jgi:hypothetical protein